MHRHGRPRPRADRHWRLSETTPTIAVFRPSRSRVPITPADAGAEPDRNIDGVEVVDRAEQLAGRRWPPRRRNPGGTTDANSQAALGRDPRPPAPWPRRSRGRARSARRRAPAWRRSFRSSCRAAPRWSPARLARAPAKASDWPWLPRVAVTIPCHLRPLALEPIEIDEAAAHLEGADRGVVLVLDDDLDAGVRAATAARHIAGSAGRSRARSA